jgi:hypothetical protein
MNLRPVSRLFVPRGIPVLVPVLVIATALVVASCGSDDTSGSSSGTPSSEMVLQVSTIGGFAGPTVLLSSVPSVTVLSDGTVITPAPMIAIYPGPAISPMQQVTVAKSVVTGFVDKARSLGLLQDSLDFGQPPVADATTTVVVIRADGREYRHQAYALGLSNGFGGLGASGPLGTGSNLAGPSSLTADQEAHRTALNTLVNSASTLPPGAKAWIPSEVAVYDLGAYTPDTNLNQTAQAWPLATLPTLGGTASKPVCTTIGGGDATKLLTALAGANQRTPWILSGSNHALSFAPVIPGAPTCS